MSLRRGTAPTKTPAIVGRGAFVALLALALQIFVAATHNHNDLFPRQLAGTGTPGATVAGLAAADRPAAPSELPRPATPDDQDTCPLCWGLHIAGAFLLPPTTPVAAPTPVAVLAATSEEDYGLPSLPFSLFRTRAPPAV